MNQVLSGHTSAETAYIVDDYPYGFRLRCKIRYWIETDPKRGQRFVTQTSNPKQENTTWNAPKKSTYSDLMVLYIEEATGHVKHDCISTEYNAESLETFLQMYGSVLTSEYEKIAIKRGRFIHLSRVAMKALVLADGIESGNIYDIPSKERRTEIVMQAKADAVKALHLLEEKTL